jgi:uncharacterized protein (DUF1778 family)
VPSGDKKAAVWHFATENATILMPWCESLQGVIPPNKGVHMNEAVERERITARVTSSVAETLSEAASLSGTTLNNFVVQAALKEAHRIIDREKTIYVSLADTSMLLNLLENPPPPNAALTKAFERFMKAKYGKEVDTTEQGS